MAHLDESSGMGSKGCRRSHRKSRGGCSFCKRRRIKCDEKKPTCSNCIKRSLVCSLHTELSLASTPETINTGTPDNSSDHLSAPMSLDVQDLQLFHHFCSFTSATFATERHFHQFWSITVAQMSFSHPFLLRAILAIGAVHMDRLSQKHGETSWYKAKAAAHWDAAIQLATTQLMAIDEDSCDPLFIFAMLTCLHTFAVGPQAGNYLLFTDDGQMEWPIFFRGLRSVADASVHLGLSDPRRPLAFMYGIAMMDLEQTALEEPDTWWGAALRDLRHATLDAIKDGHERRIYLEAHRRLVASFSAVLGDNDAVNRVRAAHVFSWMYRLSEDFIQKLQARQDVALAFFAHFVVLLKQMEGAWMMKGWPDHLISGIYSAMSPATRMWIRWPMERVGWCPLT